MNKIIVIIMFVFLSCFKSDWRLEDKKNFMQDCEQAGQNNGYCLCALECLEGSFDSYLDTQNNESLSVKINEINECVLSCINK
tara:strand:+ start:903 stop:1151 length:249 start_codon:yes stop_codon:yes gene_type:complete